MKNKKTTAKASKEVKPAKVAKVAPLKNVVQGVNLDNDKVKKVLNFANGEPKKAFADMADSLFDAKMDTASFEELMKMAIKLNIVPCADVRRLKQLIRAKRDRQKDVEATHENKITKITQPSKDMQSKVDEILGNKKK